MQIFNSNNSICKAFEYAKGEVKKKFNISEGNKLQLLLKDGVSHVCEENTICSQLYPGKFIRINKTIPRIYKVPSTVKPYIGRNKDMMEIITSLRDEFIKVV